LNPYALTGTAPSRRRVYLFHHLGSSNILLIPAPARQGETLQSGGPTRTALPGLTFILPDVRGQRTLLEKTPVNGAGVEAEAGLAACQASAPSVVIS
jgi:hypothetical protein